MAGPPDQTPGPNGSHEPGSEACEALARVRRLEEIAGFASHEAEQLAEHVRALMARIESLGRRVESLESRLRRAETAAAPASEPDEGARRGGEFE